MKRIIVAITGATGSLYGIRFVERLCSSGEAEVHLIVSPWASAVMKSETGKTADEWVSGLSSEYLTVHDHADIASTVASGSFRVHAMVVIPCTMGTLGAIASGLASNLTERAASVCLKERRQLVLVARESPLSSIHLQQMLTLSNAGAMILPPVPAFYTHPKTIEELVDTTVDRVLDAVGVDDGKAKRWRET